MLPQPTWVQKSTKHCTTCVKTLLQVSCVWNIKECSFLTSFISKYMYLYLTHCFPRWSCICYRRKWSWKWPTDIWAHWAKLWILQCGTRHWESICQSDTGQRGMLAILFKSVKQIHAGSKSQLFLSFFSEFWGHDTHCSCLWWSQQSEFLFVFNWSSKSQWIIYYVCGVFQIQRDLTIFLKEANDNKPIFQQSSYDTKTPEVSCFFDFSIFFFKTKANKHQDSQNYFECFLIGIVFFYPPNQMSQDTAVGASLFTALAEDRDLSNAGAVRYSIDEVKHPSL